MVRLINNNIKSKSKLNIKETTALWDQTDLDDPVTKYNNQMDRELFNLNIEITQMKNKIKKLKSDGEKLYKKYKQTHDPRFNDSLNTLEYITDKLYEIVGNSPL